MPPKEHVANAGAARKKPGPKPKPYTERKYIPKGPVKRVERSYRARKKEEVLMWTIHHRVIADDGITPRPPTIREAAGHFQIPKSTIAGWMKSQREANKQAEADSAPAKSAQPATTETTEALQPTTDQSTAMDTPATTVEPPTIEMTSAETTSVEPATVQTTPTTVQQQNQDEPF